MIVDHFGEGRSIRYFCEDESRFGLKTLISRVITLLGIKPIAPGQWSRENLWLYGAVEPATGAHLFYEFSHLDSVCFQRFVDLFAAAFPDTLNLLQLDQASCHIATTLKWPDNVIPIFQPAHSQATFWGEDSPQKLAPELNPIERLWEDLKKHFNGNNLDSLAALREQVFNLINALKPAAIVSLTGWSYILEALNKISDNSA